VSKVTKPSPPASGVFIPGVKPRIFIIEDQRLIADLFRMHCESEGWPVVGIAQTMAEGLAQCRDLRPDLLLLDFSLPDGNGMDVAEILMRQFPALKVIGVSSHCDGWTLMKMQRLGLHGFVDKQNPATGDLTQAVQTVLSGRTYYTPLVSKVTGALRRDSQAFYRVLSDYEMQILSLIGQSLTDDEIAAHIGISPSTVQSRRRDILRKLNIHSTPKLIHFAIQNGLTQLDQIKRVEP
jgi:DNA-binding NarL/FixJ family response regulator